MIHRIGVSQKLQKSDDLEVSHFKESQFSYLSASIKTLQHLPGFQQCLKTFRPAIYTGHMQGSPQLKDPHLREVVQKCQENIMWIIKRDSPIVEKRDKSKLPRTDKNKDYSRFWLARPSILRCFYCSQMALPEDLLCPAKEALQAHKRIKWFEPQPKNTSY